MPRLIIVSNRLPVTVRPGAAVEVEPSSGGLVSALAGLTEAEEYQGIVWIGWPGAFVANEAEEKRLTTVMQDTSMKICMVPIWLSKADVEDFYNGFCNSSLWPLLHWMTPYARFKKAWAESYRRVNEVFVDTILSTARGDDVVWVQDFHLFLVPQLLRRRRESTREQAGAAGGAPERPKDLPSEPHEEDAYATPESEKTRRPGDWPSPRRPPSFGFEHEEERPPESTPEEAVGAAAAGAGAAAGTAEEKDAAGQAAHFSRTSGVYHMTLKTKAHQEGKLKIAFFLHVPFPSYEVICSLPQCGEIVEGMLGADLVGFHTYSYLRHFRSCIVRLCGFAPEIDHVEHRGQRTKLGVFPIGANCAQIAKAMSSQKFAEHLSNYTTQFHGRSLVLSVERLDYSKGMPQKLAAIERYLELVAEREDERARRRAEEEKLRLVEGDKEEDADSVPLATSATSIEEASPGASRTLQDRLDDLLKRFGRRKAARDATTRWRFGASLKKLMSAAGRAFGNEPQAEQLDHGRTVFLFVAVPSRQEVDQYKAIELEVHRRISDINGRFSTPHYQPIVYIHRSVPMEELTALYARADCCMVTPLVDGMNLVAKEFLAAKDRSKAQVVPGTVVLSELAGAAQELFDAIVVNPYDEDAVAEAIAVGLELTRGGYLEEDMRWEVTEKMREACLENDSTAWAKALLGELEDAAGQEAAKERLGAQPQVWRDGSMQMLKDSVACVFFEANPGTKALFLDYDGTLREFEPNAEDAVPGQDARELFKGLATREDLRVFIMSGRSKEFLEEHFGDCLPFTLIAEHGQYERGPATSHEWRMFNPYTSTEWINKVKPIMDLFTRCTPGSSIEMKESAILWHYEECDEEYGQFKAKELMHQLALSLGNLPCMICQGPHVVEVCSLRIKKGLIVSSICLERERAGSPFAEVLCVGDDDTDETMFAEAPEGAWTVKVGMGETRARHRLRGPQDVRRFLNIVAEQCLPVLPGSRRATLLTGDSIDFERYRTCLEFPRGDSTGNVLSCSEYDGDPLEGLPEQETMTQGPS